MKKKEIMRIAVMGTGGVGGYFGGRLAQAGEEVVFIARGEHLEALRSTGLRVESIKGDFEINPAQAAGDPGQVGVVDAVLVCVKTWQVPEAALAIGPVVGPDSMVVPLENGVDAPAQLAAVLGDKAVLGGMCEISAFRAGPGHIRHVGIEPYVAFGELSGERTPRVEALRTAFERAGVKVAIPEDIRIAMWEKFLFIASFGGVGAVSRAPAGVMRNQPGTRKLIEQAMQEIVAVGRAKGILLTKDSVQRKMAFIDSIGPAVMASMQRDIIAGLPSELESQNGAVVRMGRETGLPTPVHEYLYASLLPQELRARGEIQF